MTRLRNAALCLLTIAAVWMIAAGPAPAALVAHASGVGADQAAGQAEKMKVPTDAEVLAMLEKSGAKLTKDGITTLMTPEPKPLSDAESALPVGSPEATVTTRGAGANAYIFIKPQNVAGLGHIGWGYFAPNVGYFIGGSTENNGANPFLTAGTYNGYWDKAWRTEAEMFAKFKQMGYYAFKRAYVANTNPDLAWGRAQYTKNNGFRGVGWNCLDHTYYVLEGFGVKNMPWKQTNPAPNGWFNAFPGTGYRLP